MAHILIVEDEYSISELMKRNLNLTGHSCDQAFDGQGGKDLYLKNTYDLILLDIMLPKITGYEVMQIFTDVPVIFITAKDNASDKLKGLTSGAEDYIVKPFDILEILIQNRNMALSREKLLELAWGYEYEGDTRTVDVHIQKLHKKLGWEERIKTVYKMGYRLEVPK